MTCADCRQHGTSVPSVLVESSSPNLNMARAGLGRSFEDLDLS
jgi:hypothetical protein